MLQNERSFYCAKVNFLKYLFSEMKQNKFFSLSNFKKFSKREYKLEKLK